MLETIYLAPQGAGWTRPRGRHALFVERIIAIARAALAGAALPAVWLDPTRPARFAHLVELAVFGYFVYSGAILAIALRADDTPPRRLISAIHAVDVVWAVAISVITLGVGSPFYPFFLFAVLAAAFRWELRQVLATTFWVAGSLILEQLTAILWFSSLAPQAGLRLTIIRVAYVLVMGAMIGYLAESEKLLRASSATVASILSKLRMDRGFRAGMEDLLGHLLEVFQASKVLIVARDRNAGITYQYELRLSHHLLSRELNDADSASWFVDAGAPTFSVRRVAGGFTCGTLMDGRVHRGELKPGCDLPQGWATALVASFELPDWHGRLYVVNPGPEPRETVALRLLHSICEQALPAMHNLYLVGRLRSRSIAVERARLARELHDGPVQSLLGIRLQLEALRRSPETSNSASTQLGEVQELLKSEVVGLRELQERLRPVAVGPENLAASLTRAAEKFEQNTGIRALCSFEAQQIDLTPSACYELYRIAEEALINVRKHSRASEVRISLVSFGSRLMLQVSDNGKGMPFEGRLALAEMERTHAGPVVIRERVRAIGGELIVRSKPGEGTQILVEVARRAAAASAAHA